jgi:hypothetical protein
MEWLDDLVKLNSKFYGEYYCKKVKDFFEEGDLVTVYSHYSFRLYAVGKQNKIFRIHYVDFGTIFFTKEEWRSKKINKILR